MFIISLTYKVDLDRIDAHLAEHVQYLNKQYALGNFSVSGRKVPRTGGVILSKMKNRADLDLVLEEDPFFQQQLANYEVTEFIASKVSDELSCLSE